MIRMGMMIGLNPDRVEEYKVLHQNVWPPVLEKIKNCNIRNYSIFIREPENLLFGYFEYHGDDFEADMARMAADEETQRWWQFTDSCQAPLSSISANQWWAPLQEVFHVN